MTGLTPVTLVTGASSGIGAALARVFAQNGHDLVLVARSEDRLTAVADEIAGNGNRRPLVMPFDLTRLDSTARLAHELTARRLEPAVVVNAAGFGLYGRAAEIDRVEQLAMIDLNIRALTDLSLRFIESLARHKGGILNVASFVGFLPGPGMAVYYASKAYVISFSEALQRELAPLGVRVTVLCPGPVPTGFQARAGIDDSAPRMLVRSADEVARAGYEGFAKGRRLVIPGLGNKAVTLIPRILSRGVLLSVMEKALKGRGLHRASGWPRQ